MAPTEAPPQLAPATLPPFVGVSMVPRVSSIFTKGLAFAEPVSTPIEQPTTTTQRRRAPVQLRKVNPFTTVVSTQRRAQNWLRGLGG